MSQLAAVFDTVLPDPDSLAASDLGDWLIAEERETRRRAAWRAQVLARFDSAGASDADGFPTTGSWLRAHLNVSSGTATARVQLARTLPTLPVTTVALEDGRISEQHAQAIAGLTKDIPVEYVRSTETEFVTVAERVDPQSLRAYLRGIRHAYQPEAVVAAEEDQYQRRQFTLTRSFEGMVVMGGQAHVEGGAIIDAALRPLAQPTGPDDERTAGQRNYDALETICRSYLDAGQLPAQGGFRSHVSIVADVATVLGTPGARMADLGYAGQISGEALRRILCDAKISRIITDGPSEILDVGREVRTVTPAQRRALNIRDKECVWPGCHVPHDWCDAHHLIFWMFGGASDLANYALICPAHHRYVHEGGWTLRRNADGSWDALPP